MPSASDSRIRISATIVDHPASFIQQTNLESNIRIRCSICRTALANRKISIDSNNIVPIHSCSEQECLKAAWAALYGRLLAEAVFTKYGLKVQTAFER